MSEGSNNSLVNLGDISKPADTLIKKISNAVGGAFAPRQIRRLAQAEAAAAITKAEAAAEVALIQAETEIRITDLHRRAAHRMLDEEAKRQANMEAITEKSLPLLTSSANADGIEDDWIVNFFEKSRLFSDDEMQSLWARILAGQANSPGSYSRRTVNFLADLDKSDCELFAKVCNFSFEVGGSILPLIFSVNVEPSSAIYHRHGINFAALSHLDSIGLLQFGHLTGYRQQKIGRHWAASYHGRQLVLTMPQETDNDLEFGRVMLTRIGRELSRICAQTPIDGFFEYVCNRWAAYIPAPPA